MILITDSRMLEEWKAARSDREQIKNLIIYRGAGLVERNEIDIVIEALPDLARMMAKESREAGFTDTADQLELAAKVFPETTWSHIAMLMAKESGVNRYFKNGKIVWLPGFGQPNESTDHGLVKTPIKPSGVEPLPASSNGWAIFWVVVIIALIWVAAYLDFINQ